MNQNGLPDQYNTAREPPSSAYGFGLDAVARRVVSKLLGLVYTRAVPVNFYSSGYVVDTTARTMVGASTKRRYLAIQNNGASAIYIAFGNTPSVGGVNSFVMGAGAVFTFENGYVAQNELRAIGTAPTNVAIIEGVEIDFAQKQ